MTCASEMIELIEWECIYITPKSGCRSICRISAFNESLIYEALCSQIEIFSIPILKWIHWSPVERVVDSITHVATVAMKWVYSRCNLSYAGFKPFSFLHSFSREKGTIHLKAWRGVSDIMQGDCAVGRCSRLGTAESVWCKKVHGKR